MSRRAVVSWVSGVALLLAFQPAGPAAAAVKTLAVPLVTQQQNQWCWAGVSDAVLAYYGKDVEQCWMANFAWSRTDCCTSPGSASCNQPNAMYGTAGSLQAILRRWCVNSSSVNRALGFRAVRGQVDANRPLVIRYGWDGGGGHFIAVRGYSTTAPKYLYLMNPWPGDGYGMFTYDAVKRTVGDHTWTHTLNRVRRNRSQGDWTISRSNATKVGSTWNYRLNLRETDGGCGRVLAWYADHYDASGLFLGTSSLTAQNFADWFTGCSDGDDLLPRRTTLCGNLSTYLGGRSRGAVRFRFRIRCDSGRTVTEMRRFALTAAGGGPGADEGSGEPLGESVTGFGGE